MQTGTKGVWRLGIGDRAKNALKAVSNVHRQGTLPNVFLFATARGGSTWVMEILASQPGMKFYDEPFNIRRDNVSQTGLFPNWESLMPDTGDADGIVAYLNGLVSGAYPYMNPPPFRPHHRLMTDRVVFKIHEMEHLIGRIERECQGQVVYLLRHPIPTTLSRTVLPRLDLFLASAYYDEVLGKGPRLEEIKRLGRDGNRLQKGVVSWCYENVIPLRQPGADWLFVTYEELVLNPARSCELLLERLNFTDREAMLDAFGKAAVNIGMSSADTMAAMTKADKRARATSLVTRWRPKTTDEDRAAVSAIMALFDLDVYTGEQTLSHPRYLHFEDTPTLLAAPADAGVPA
jgi:hypothetical protein